jgi:hypothetical protein
MHLLGNGMDVSVPGHPTEREPDAEGGGEKHAGSAPGELLDVVQRALQSALLEAVRQPIGGVGTVTGESRQVAIGVTRAGGHAVQLVAELADEACEPPDLAVSALPGLIACCAGKVGSLVLRLSGDLSRLLLTGIGDVASLGSRLAGRTGVAGPG